MDDQAVIERLRSDLRAQSDEAPTPDWLLGAAHRRWRRRRARRAGAGVVLAAVVLVGGAVIAGQGGEPDAVDAGPASPGPSTTTSPATTSTTTLSSTTQAFADGPPSQSPEDAARDGVIPELAALPLHVRTVIPASVVVPEGEWAISEPSQVVLDLADDSCHFGDLSGTPHVDSICAGEYAEVVLLDTEGQIARAYPMGGVKPSWIHVTDDAVYGGRVGDGGLPDSTLFRIDRATLELRGLVFPSTESPGVPGQDGFLGRTAASWRVAPDGVALGALVTFGDDTVGTAVTSVIGPLGVDLAGIEALFA
jgi:hypothetical protein